VEFFVFERMDLGMFDRFCPSMETRAQIEERRFDMNRSDSEGYVIPMHRKNLWTKSGCRILERIFCRYITVIPVRSTCKVGDHLRERED
jgi:hypothetical protein